MVAVPKGNFFAELFSVKSLLNLFLLGFLHKLQNTIIIQEFTKILEAFSFLHFCPPSNVVELLKIANFYWARLECWSSWHYFCLDMRSIVLATLNNILHQKNGVLYNMDLVYEFFDEMDKTYNFTLGPAILSLMTESQLRDMAQKDYPFLRNHKLCLLDPQCSILANGTQHLPGNFLLLFQP